MNKKYNPFQHTPVAISIAVFVLMILTGHTPQVFARDINSFRIFTDEYPPSNYTEQGVLTGTSTEIMLAVLKKLGASLGRKHIQVVPWARAYDEVLHNTDTMLFSIMRTPEREKLFKWVGPIRCSSIGVIAHKRDRVTIETPSDFEKYRIGVVREDIGHQMMRQIIPEKDLDIANSSTSNLRKLKEGRIDMFIYDLEVASFVLQRLELNPQDFEVVYVLGEWGYGVAFNKNVDDELINTFQTALDEVMKTRPANLCKNIEADSTTTAHKHPYGDLKLALSKP